MNPWIEAAKILALSVAIVSLFIAWAYPWIYLNVKKSWPTFPCITAALLPFPIGLYFLTVHAISTQ